MIAQLASEYPVQLLCRVFAFPRSSFYHPPQPRAEAALRQALMELAGHWPTYGYRRLTQLLRRQEWEGNEKRVRRLKRELALLCKTYRSRPRPTDRTHAFPRYPNLVANWRAARPDQVRVVDIT